MRKRKNEENFSLGFETCARQYIFYFSLLLLIFYTTVTI